MLAIGGGPGSSSRDHALSKVTDSEDSCDIQELVVVFSALKVDTVVTQEDVSAWLECDSDLPTCQTTSDEAIVQDISQAANKCTCTCL